jgi:hypothetical protein
VWSSGNRARGSALTQAGLARSHRYHSAETLVETAPKARSARVMRDTNGFDTMPFDKMPFDLGSIDTD